MAGPREPLLTLLLPGLEGSGRLFSRFVAEADPSLLDLRPIPYPQDAFRSYHELEDLVWTHLPRDRPFAVLGESFSGPIALRIGARAPPGLLGVVLVATFHLQPASPLFQKLAPLAPVFFRMPLPPHVVRLLLAGRDAPEDLVSEIRAVVAEVPAAIMAARVHAALQVDATEALRACRVPLLILAGKRDRLLRRQLATEMRAVAPNAEVRILDVPHLVLQRKPREAMQVVQEFLLRCARQRLPSSGE